jgi:hypothetical protein
MKRKLLILSVVLLALAPAAFADVILSVDPSAQTKLLGQVVTVTIKSSGGYVGGFDLNISWDSTILFFNSINYGTQLGGGVQNTFFGPATVNATEISLLTPAELIALQPGPGATLLTLVFSTIALGTSDVQISYNAIGDENGLSHNVVDLNDGEITVIQGIPVPEPGSTTLLPVVAGLAALWLHISRVCRVIVASGWKLFGAWR